MRHSPAGAAPVTPRFLAPLLTPIDVATMLQVEAQTLAKWRMRGNGPAFTRCGRSIRYTPDAVHAFLSARTGMSTAALDAALA